MDNQKELKDDQLDKVSGGKAGIDGIDTNGQFGCLKSMYELVIGNEYYFVYIEEIECNKYTHWFKAKVLASYEGYHTAFSTIRCHEVDVIQCGTSTFNRGKTVIHGDNYAAYITKYW